MASRVTIKEIAQLAGVNISTVSRALNPETSYKVSSSQREKIISLCNQYNYRPRVAARGCATGKTFHVALMLGAITKDLSSPFQALFIKGACSVLQAAGYTLSILWTEENPDKRDDVVKNFLMSEIADGYILGAPLLTAQTMENFSNLHPILSFKSIQKDLDNDFFTLSFDPLTSFKKIWQVIPKELEENIIFTGPISYNTQRKYELFSSCSPKGKLVKTLFFNPQQEHCAFHYDYLCARNFFNNNYQSFIDAKLIVCSSDLIAHALCDELTFRGKKVGSDIFVLGYDNLENTTPYPGKKPYLSTIDPHWEEAGRASAAFILDAIKKTKNENLRNTSIESSYICRESFPFDVCK